MKTVIKFLSICLLSFSLVACSATPIKETKVIELPRLNPNLPPEVTTQNIEWKVMTPTDLKKANVTLYTLTPEEFTKLSGNLTEMYRYILQIKETVKFYREQNTASQVNPK